MDQIIRNESEDTLPSRDEGIDLPRNPECNRSRQRKAVDRILDCFANVFQNGSQDIMQQFSQLEEILGQKDSELQEAKQRIQQLENELDDCRTRIFRSILTYEISDATISEEYSRLREKYFQLDRRACRDFRIQETYCEKVDHSGPYYPEIRNINLIPGGYDAAQFEVLMQVIFYSLWSRIFDVPVFEAEPPDLQLLETLQSEMCRLEPKKDAKSLHLWKSDTIRAYTSCEKYQDRVKLGCHDLMIEVCDFLKLFTFERTINWDRKGDRFK